MRQTISKNTIQLMKMNWISLARRCYPQLRAAWRWFPHLDPNWPASAVAAHLYPELFPCTQKEALPGRCSCSWCPFQPCPHSYNSQTLARNKHRSKELFCLEKHLSLCLHFTQPKTADALQNPPWMSIHQSRASARPVKKMLCSTPMKKTPRQLLLH